MARKNRGVRAHEPEGTGPVAGQARVRGLLRARSCGKQAARHPSTHCPGPHVLAWRWRAVPEQSGNARTKMAATVSMRSTVRTAE
eukprot:4090700-Lingulodinium_polyedra.AAC.1